MHKVWKFFSFFTYLSLEYCHLYCSMRNDHCTWVIDAVPKENMTKVASRIVQNGQYYLRMRIKCNEMINSQMLRSLVFTGVNPRISVESEEFGTNYHKDSRFSSLILSVLVELGDQDDCGCIVRNESIGNSWSSKCICSGSKPCCFQSQASSMIDEGIKCCEVEKNCSIYSGLCNPAWVVPLYIPQTAAILHSKILDSGVGPDVNFHRLTVHMNAFHLSINDTPHSRLGKEVSELQATINQPVAVNCLPNMAPVCIIASRELADHVIYTNTEFENIGFLKIQLGDSVRNKCRSKQSLSTVEIKGSLSLPDRIILNTDAGLYEIQVQASQIKTRVEPKFYSRVLKACVRHVVGPAQPSAHSIIVLGFGEEQDKEKVFAALLDKGTPSEFHEQTDLDGLNACQFLKLQKQLTGNELCQVISGSVSGVTPGAFVVLVKLETLQAHTFHLLLCEVLVNGGSWRLLFQFPRSLRISRKTDIWDSWVEIDPETASYQGCQAAELILDGLSFTAFVSKSLFLWGNNLLYSPDGGHSIRWWTNFPSNSTIVVFTSSPFDGLFAFLTHDREVWIGQEGPLEYND